jgi:hypothetical protein
MDFSSSTNHFMAMLAAVEEAVKHTFQVAADLAVDFNISRPQDVKLPEFWPHAPALWFSRAECMFRLHTALWWPAFPTMCCAR